MIRVIIFGVCLLSWACAGSRAEELTADEQGRALIQAAQLQILAYHRDAEPAGNLIRVVYFHPSDRPPLAKWRSRLTRMIDDVSDFYRVGLGRFGVANRSLPFERDDQGYVFHLVEGKLPASEYDHDSGRVIGRELRAKLDQTIDFDHEHVLVVHGLCHQEKDGRYVFNAPYYGRGTQKNGLCHAADCELLDPLLLKEKDKEIVYAEHYYPRKEQTIGLFNSWYLGGLAHEMGHGIGLPHDAGRPWERAQTGHALMGSGNHHYREELRGGTEPAYLSLGSALRLLSHPLLTDSNRERFIDPESELEKLQFSSDDKNLILVGKIRGKVPSYAVIAYLWRPRLWPGDPQQDHESISHPTSVTDNDFDLNIRELRPGDYRLRLSVLHCNGAESEFDYHLKVDREGKPNVAELNGSWLLARAETAVRSQDPTARGLVSEEAIKNAPTAELKAKLGVLRDLLDPPDPIDLSATPEKKVSLSDAVWVSAKVGWGKIARNHYSLQRDHRNSIYLELSGKLYGKGLYAHSQSAYVFDLDKRWTTLTATVGLRDGAHEQGSAVFVVRGDDKELYRSPVLKEGQSADVKIDVSDVKKLELTADGGEGHVHNSWAIWAAPMLTR